MIHNFVRKSLQASYYGIWSKNFASEELARIRRKAIHDSESQVRYLARFAYADVDGSIIASRNAASCFTGQEHDARSRVLPRISQWHMRPHRANECRAERRNSQFAAERYEMIRILQELVNASTRSRSLMTLIIGHWIWFVPKCVSTESHAGLFNSENQEIQLFMFRHPCQKC